ncbi:MAG: hypothetical protein CMM07_25810 [Rhodopirellula sp.]|nr:hypothetical protein [Rhodopirellula sp.]
MTLTYKAISERCANAALELTPDFPKTGTLEAWIDFQNECEALDAHVLAWGEVDGWDWSIYTHYGIKIVDLMPQSDLNDAEAQWHDMDGPSCIDESFGVYEFASKVAYFYLVSQVTEHIEALKEELIDMAQGQIDNLEAWG